MVQPEWGPKAGWTSMRIVGSPAAPEVMRGDYQEKKKTKKKPRNKRENKQKVIAKGD